MRAVALAIVVAIAALGALALIRNGTSRQTTIAGAAMMVVGAPFLVLSRRQLGTAFSVAPQAKGLVTGGLYSRIPHPMYVFLDLLLLGGIIALRRESLLIAWLVLILIQAWQARRETKVLEQAFGDAYRNYRKRTWW